MNHINSEKTHTDTHTQHEEFIDNYVMNDIPTKCAWTSQWHANGDDKPQDKKE